MASFDHWTAVRDPMPQSALPEQLAYVIVRIMVSIQQAAENAITFAIAALGPERTTFIRLEEVESTRVGSEDAWLITLSMISPDEQLNRIAAVLGKGKREYKSFTVLKGNGEVTSMKIRELADV